MARTKQFDPDAVLDAAMRIFWQLGYDGTSTAHLVNELGVGRASLYDTFGSKRELYLAALDRFLAGRGSPPDDLFAAGDSALEAIQHFLMLNAVPPPEGDPAGCFAVNATVESSDAYADTAWRLEGNRSRLESALYSALLRARADGELAAHVDPRAAASMLVALNTGLKVLMRAGDHQRERIRASVEAALSGLARHPGS
jgi:TetR/AcrR family transcriptional repressor of nem operon